MRSASETRESSNLQVSSKKERGTINRSPRSLGSVQSRYAMSGLLLVRNARSSIGRKIRESYGTQNVHRTSGSRPAGRHRPGLHIHRVLGLVSQMRATILHLGDARVRIVRMRPVFIGSLLGPLAIQFG